MYYMEEQYQLHLLAESRAGHDRGKIYVVVGEEEDFVYLSDGRLKTMKKCKKKNRKHVQLIAHLPEELLQLLSRADADSDLVHILRLYRSES